MPIDANDILPSNGVYEKKSEIYDCFKKDKTYYEECNDSTTKRKNFVFVVVCTTTNKVQVCLVKANYYYTVKQNQ